MRASCTCHSAPDLCATGVIERPCYYPGQLLTPAELTLEQQYFRDKMRRHNRLLHGWGVVCGAAVCLVHDEPARDSRRAGYQMAPAQATSDGPAQWKPKPWKVRVSPGYILGPYGDEILIDREQIVDLRTCGQSGAAGEHRNPPDPWCADVYVQRDPGRLFVAVRYQEMKSRQVRVQPTGCGCDDTQCEYSRCRDGYEICVLTECPPSHENPPEIDDVFRGPLPECPDCPTDPWVVLARVEVDANGTITEIDNCGCRRLVASFAGLWRRCTGDACAVRSVEVEGGRRVEVGRDFVMNVRAYDLPNTVTVNLGDHVTTTAVVSENGTRLQVNAKAEAAAAPGLRTLEIRDGVSHRLIAASRNAVEIVAAGTMTAPRAAPPADKPARPKPPRGRGKSAGGGPS